MAYVVDRVVICDAFREPDRHYQLLLGGKSRLVHGRRPSMRSLASAKDVKGGIAGEGEWRHTRVVLSPANPEYEPIVIPAEAAEDIRVVAEFMAVMRTAT